MPMSHLQHNSSFGRRSLGSRATGVLDEQSALLLLRLAHDSISSAFEHREISFDPPTPHLAEPRGAFTSLYLHGELRGCVGYVLPTSSVYQAVAETARAAAFERQPLSTCHQGGSSTSRNRAKHSLSRHSPIEAEAVEVGRHGLLISQHGRRGLLLPQVPVEHKWDRITFLEQTCRKAGLAPGCLAKRRNLQAFTAEIFSDKSF